MCVYQLILAQNIKKNLALIYIHLQSKITARKSKWIRREIQMLHDLTLNLTLHFNAAEHAQYG